MAPLEQFVKWAKHYEDFRRHTVDVKETEREINVSSIPFYPEVVPAIVHDQCDAWLDIIFKIHDMVRDSESWDPHIDQMVAYESLLMFKNLLLAPKGLKIEHLDNGHAVRFTRLGPGALLQEIRAATVGSKVCAYYKWQPFDKLQELLKKYKQLLRRTDANPSRRRNPKKRNKRRYDKSIEKQMPALMNAVYEAQAASDALWKELDAELEKNEPDDAKVSRFHDKLVNLDKEEKLARDKACWQFHFIHYIKARVEETDVEAPRLPEPIRKHSGNESPRFSFLENWKQQSHVPDTVDRITSSLFSLKLTGEVPQKRKLRIRERIYNDEEDDDDGTDTATVCSTKTLVPESRVSETDQSESSLRAASPPLEQDRHVEEDDPESTLSILNLPRAINPDWEMELEAAYSESESESESEDEVENESDSDL